MVCKLEQALPVGGTEASPAADLLIVRVVRFRVEGDVYRNGYLNPAALNPVSRLAGSLYATLGRTFALVTLRYSSKLPPATRNGREKRRNAA